MTNISFHTSKHTFGDIVYIKTDLEQNKWMVVEVMFTPNDVMYHLSQGDRTVKCYDIEISDGIDETMKLGLTQNKEK